MENEIDMIEKKVYVLGEDGCGKSSLLFALTGIQPNTTTEATHKKGSLRRTTQVDIVTKVRRKRNCLCPCFAYGPSRLLTREEKLVLIFSECVEKESRVRAMNYLDTDAVLLCFDISSHSSLEKLRQVWLPEVKYYCPDEVPIIVASLKSDEMKPPNKENLFRRASSLFRTRKIDATQRAALKLIHDENIFSYIRCSAKDKVGIDDLKQALCQAVTMVTSRKKASPALRIN